MHKVNLNNDRIKYGELYFDDNGIFYKVVEKLDVAPGKLIGVPSRTYFAKMKDNEFRLIEINDDNAIVCTLNNLDVVRFLKCELQVVHLDGNNYNNEIKNLSFTHFY